MRIAIWLVVGLLAGMSRVSMATTWGDDTVRDPVDGRRCKVSMPMSSGSYIYQWPEKYDQVFWPFTDPQGIWTCAGSGFAAFLNDIELDAGERDAVAAFLREAGPLTREAGPREVLERLRSIYALRTLDPDRRTWVLRALAWQYEQAGAQAEADGLRAEAATLIDQRLSEDGLETALRLQYLFVAANYARERGDVVASDARLAELSSVAKDASGGAAKGYAEYLSGLLESARRITPGNTLAPSD